MKKAVKIPFICALALACVCAVCIGVSALGAEGGTSLKQLPVYYISGSEDSTCSYSAKTAIPDRAGVTATLVGKDALLMRRVVDLKDLSVEKPLITVYPLAEKAGHADYLAMYIDVIDVYDESNYFTLSVKPYPYHEDDYEVCYSLAYASNGQLPTSLDRDGKYIHVSDMWGTWTHISLAGNIGELGTIQNNFISLCYDENENTVFVRDMHDVNFFISDLDDPVYYGKNVWKGFTTGEVYCRVRLSDYTSSSGSFLVTQYGGVDLSIDTLVNEQPPKITVDMGEYADSGVPVAAVGKAYNVFPARATDLYYGDVAITTKVYTNYYSLSKTEVNLKQGAFTPRIPVDHYIEYTAEGSAEDKGVVVVQVPMDKNYQAPTIVFDNFPSKWSLGEKAALPEYTVEKGSGKSDVSLKVTNGSVTLSTDGGTVQPKKLAPMLFTYTLTDYLGTETVIEKTVQVERATKPTFGDIPRLPDVMAEGVPYEIPEVQAYNYITAEGTPVNVEASVVYKGSSTVINGKYTPSVENNKDVVTVRYTARVGDAVSIVEKNVTVYKVKTGTKLDMTKYFETSGEASLSATKQSIELTGSDTTDFDFINAVGANNFKTTFITGKADGIDRFDIFLTDIDDPGNVLKFTYKKSGATIIFFVNDNEKQAFSLTSSFASKSVMGLTLDLNKGVAFFDVNGALSAAITTNYSGKPFTGFAYGKANIRYHMEGTSYTIGLQTINNQFMSSDSTDFIGPNLDVNGDYGGEKVKGESFVLPDVSAVDVLTGDAVVYVSVQRPNGAYLYENVLLSAAKDPITVTEFGGYYVEITAKDGNGRTSTFTYVITVIDDQAPFLGEIAEIADTTVGKKVIIPRPNATDNIDGTVEVKRYISYPGGQFKLLGTYDGIVVKSEGVYTVVFVATDSFGNRTTAVRTFEVR